MAIIKKAAPIITVNKIIGTITNNTTSCDIIIPYKATDSTNSIKVEIVDPYSQNILTYGTASDNRINNSIIDLRSLHDSNKLSVNNVYYAHIAYYESDTTGYYSDYIPLEIVNDLPEVSIEYNSVPWYMNTFTVKLKNTKELVQSCYYIISDANNSNIYYTSPLLSDNFVQELMKDTTSTTAGTKLIIQPYIVNDICIKYGLQLNESAVKLTFIVNFYNIKSYSHTINLSIAEHTQSVQSNVFVLSPKCSTGTVNQNNGKLTAINDYDNGFNIITLNLDGLSIQENDNAFKYIMRNDLSDNKVDTLFFEYDTILNDTIITNITGSLIDKTVQQGHTYDYYYVYYNQDYGDTRCWATDINVDYEHMYLIDAEKQLCIMFNPKVSSFKTTILEQKTDALGGTYPLFFRNGDIAYKEFPISGLIATEMDEQQMFWKQNINQSQVRKETPVSDSINENIDKYKDSREFNLAVLDWLNNGKPKIFKSPTEGCYVVRLMNVSLTPNDTLSRRICDFSATAYECMDFNEVTLEDLK